MSKQIIDHGFGVIEMRETFCTEETISKLNQQIAELQKQLEEKNETIEGLVEEQKNIENSASYQMFLDIQKQLEEKEKIIQMQQNIKRYDIGKILTENTKLRRQLKSQPAEIVEKINGEIYTRMVVEGKETKYTDINLILHNILKEYQK